MSEILFIETYNDNSLKELSFEDETYFTIRDLFWNDNWNSYKNAIIANDFNFKLTNDIYYEDKKPDFTYTNVLNELTYVKELYNWLLTFNDKTHFDTRSLQNIIEEGTTLKECFDEGEFILFDEWWDNFVNFRKKIAHRYEELLFKPLDF